MMIHEYDIIKTFYEVESNHGQMVNDDSLSIEEQNNLKENLQEKDNLIAELKEQLNRTRTKVDELQAQNLLYGDKTRVVDFEKRCLFDDMLLI